MHPLALADHADQLAHERGGQHLPLASERCQPRGQQHRASIVRIAAAGGLLAAPVANLVSRWSEARADWVALEVTRDPVTAVAVERRLALENRADLRPNRLLVALFASHPVTMARIAQAWLWAERH